MEEGNTEVVLELLDWGADINVEEEEGLTPLLMAAEKGHFELVRIYKFFLLYSLSNIFSADYKWLYAPFRYHTVEYRLRTYFCLIKIFIKYI